MRVLLLRGVVRPRQGLGGAAAIDDAAQEIMSGIAVWVGGVGGGEGRKRRVSDAVIAYSCPTCQVEGTEKLRATPFMVTQTKTKP